MSKLVEAKLDSCPYCGGTEFIKAGMYCDSDIKLHSGMRKVPICVAICRDCGSVVRIYTEHAEKLLPLFQRKKKCKNVNKENKKIAKKQKNVSAVEEEPVIEVNSVVEVVEPND